jgi:hypothetical protein
VLAQIEEDLAIEHAILIQVENLGSARLPGLHFLLFLDLFLFCFLVGLVQLFFPGLVHLINQSLISSDITLRTATPATTTTTLAKSLVFFGQFTDKFVLR